jgi:hypothetical protein
MKLKFSPFLALIVLALVSVSAYAQTIKITPKKIVYTRKFKVSLKEKRTFIVTYPVVSGAITVAAKKNLENTISFWRVFETSLKENLNESDWLYEMFYNVDYNKSGVLDISLLEEGSAAYPDGRTVNLVIDLKTGKQVKFEDVFKTDSLEKFAGMVNSKLETEKKEIIESIRTDKQSYTDEENRKSDMEMIEALKFTPETFGEFTVSDKGVTILYDAGFPHVIQALQPDGSYFFTWAEVKPFIKPGGLLARFIR